MKTKLTLAVASLLLFAATANARYYVPKAHTACRTHFVRRTVHVRERRRGHLVRRHHHVVWVKQTRCVYVTPKAAASAPSPTSTTPAPSGPTTNAAPVQYSTAVDPSFTQDPANPLKATYDYNATAFAGNQNLGAIGQLPAGILNFYSPSSPGQPAGLVCSINVGGSVVAGKCPVTYSSTGTYSVTTEYVPNAASAVTQTDTETINPYSTTTAVSSVVGATTGNHYNVDVGSTVRDPSGNSVGSGQTITYAISDATTGAPVESFTQAGGCSVLVTNNPPSQGTMTFSSQSCNGFASMTVPASDSYLIVASFSGSPGYLSSTSTPAAF